MCQNPEVIYFSSPHSISKPLPFVWQGIAVYVRNAIKLISLFKNDFTHYV